MSAKQRRNQSILGVNSILSHTTALNDAAAITRERERGREDKRNERGMRRASRGVKRKSYAPRREADSKRNFLFVNCPHEKNELAAGKQNTRIIIIIIIIAKEEEEEQTDTRTSISFNLSSSLTLNKEYPAGVSNKSSISFCVYLARLVLSFNGERRKGSSLEKERPDLYRVEHPKHVV